MLTYTFIITFNLVLSNFDKFINIFVLRKKNTRMKAYAIKITR